MHVGGTDVLLVTLGSDVYTKSPRTRSRFRATLERNLQASLACENVTAGLRPLDAGRLILSVATSAATATNSKLREAADAAARTFGVQRIERARPLTWAALEELAGEVAQASEDRVRGRSFAVRVRRHGTHPWTSTEAERVIGARLLAASAGVDLSDPDVEVPVVVVDDQAWLILERWDGPGGMPLGTQEGCLSLLSGGFDSPVAAWMLMRKGSPVDFVHVQLSCAQTDHALAVAHDLWRRWGAGTSPLAWILDFTGVQQLIRDRIHPSLRQVVLKQLMFAAADRVAAELDLPALVTGESVGQVSSQTLRHLHEIDRSSTRVVIRPLAGFDKQEIIAKARAIGTERLSARAQEVCDLSGGHRVAVAARAPELGRARAALPGGLVDEAVRTRRVVALEDWLPGSDPVPVLDRPPEAVPVVGVADPLPQDGAVAVTGPGAARLATRLRAGGRDAVVVATPPSEPLLAG